MSLAPIVLFVYNRPWHTEQTLTALANNQLASDSDLIIYADGPKGNATQVDVERIGAVEKVIKRNWNFKSLKIILSELNKGLADSIIWGVTEVVNKYGKIIVLEDDVMPHVGFLSYMNQVLDKYEQVEDVGCIHAWTYDFMNTMNQSTFFLMGADCWGWATWKRSWDLFEHDSVKHLDAILASGLEYGFNRNESHNFVAMLRQNIAGEINSWAINWHASLYLQNKLCFHPRKPLVFNIGLDGSGEHCGQNTRIIQNNNSGTIQILDIPIEQSNGALKLMMSNLIKPNKKNNWQNLKASLRNLFLR